MQTLPAFDGLLIGKGFNAATQQIHGEAIVHDGLESLLPHEKTGQTTEFHLAHIKSSEELAKQLGISASASYGSLSFSASAEVEFANKLSLKRYSSYVLVKIDVKNPSETMRNPRLTPDALAFLEQNGWNRFEEVYGPEFIAGRIAGGSYYGLIEIITENQEQRRDLTVKVSAAGWGGKIEGQLDHKFKNVLSGFEKRVTVLQRGGLAGGKDRIIETDLDDMIKQARTFSEDALTHPVAYRALTISYRDIVPLAQPPGPDEFVQQQRAEVLAELNRKYLFYRDLRADIDFVQNHILDFEEHQTLDETELDARQQRLGTEFAKVSQQLDEIGNRIRTCRRQSNVACELPTEYYIVDPDLLPKVEGYSMLLKRMEEEITKLRQAMTFNARDVSVGERDVKVQGGKYRRLIVDADYPGLELVSRQQNAKNGYPHIDLTNGKLNNPNYGVRLAAPTNSRLVIEPQKDHALDVNIKGNLHVSGAVYSERLNGAFGVPNVKAQVLSVSDREMDNQLHELTIDLGGEREFVAFAALASLRPHGAVDKYDSIRVGVVKVDGKPITQRGSDFHNKQLLPKQTFRGQGRKVTFGFLSMDNVVGSATCIVMHD